jgi:hypothetical protein
MQVIRFVALGCAMAAAAAAHGHDCRHHGCGACAPACASDTRQTVTASPATAVAISGKIVEIDYLPAASPGQSLVVVRIDGGSPSEWVRLAPAGFLSQSGLNLREGDFVSARGYLVAGAEGATVVATEISAAGRTLRLRDGRGRREWR